MFQRKTDEQPPKFALKSSRCVELRIISAASCDFVPPLSLIGTFLSFTMFYEWSSGAVLGEINPPDTEMQPSQR